MEYQISQEKLSQAMLSAGLTSISALADKAKVHRNSLAAYLSGKRSPFTGVMDAIASCLQVDPASLLTRTGSASKWINAVKGALRPCLTNEPPRALFLFGSRARRTHKKYSDIDFAIAGGLHPLSSAEFLRLKETVAQASDDFPIMVDIVNLDQAPGDFLTSVAGDLRLIAGDQQVETYLKGLIDGIKKVKQS
jgi:transcriptional regulator with XRE-family HTH domain